MMVSRYLLACGVVGNGRADALWAAVAVAGGEGWVARVFVSHASDDHRLADEFLRWLAGAGHEVFLDQDLRAGLTIGEDWKQRLFEC